MPPKDLPSYVEWVIEQKPELRDTPADVKAELKTQLQERVENLINSALLAAMPADVVPNFERILVDGNERDIDSFISRTVPQKEEIIAQVLLQFRNDYIGT